jgi:hypothetical protein
LSSFRIYSREMDVITTDGQGDADRMGGHKRTEERIRLMPKCAKGEDLLDRYLKSHASISHSCN